MDTLLFVPDTGHVTAPILAAGWTLNYEILFYALFALCLFIPQSGHRMVAVCGAVVTLWLAALIKTGNPYLAYWGRSIILVALGIVVWHLSQTGVARPSAAAAKVSLPLWA